MIVEIYLGKMDRRIYSVNEVTPESILAIPNAELAKLDDHPERWTLIRWKQEYKNRFLFEFQLGEMLTLMGEVTILED